MQNCHKRTLVLNADYRPLGVISWRRAVVLSIINDDDDDKGVRVVDHYENDSIKGANGKTYPIPAVVVVAQYVRKKKHSIPFSRKNVFIRDQMKCQYCGEQHKAADLTFDHVIPRAKWKKQSHNGRTPTQWNNIVTACIPCNRKKANKTPKEAKMHLIQEPQAPDPYGYILGMSPWSEIPSEWRPYLTSIYKNIV